MFPGSTPGGSMLGRYLVHKQARRGAATHTLIIGVGNYPHLNGGSKGLTEYHDGMKQLTSPQVSARAFTKWLISDYNNPARPLSTVSLLLSERKQPQIFKHPVSGKEISVEAATYDNTEKAITDWKDRGEENDKNLLMFYFCGHASALGPDMTLLLSDYGKKSGAPLENALDFRRLRLGMSRRKPQQQIYFVDACRAGSDTLIQALGYAGRVPVHPGSEPTAEAPVFYATLMGEAAFGKEKSVSVFTDGLIRGFRGAGSDDSEGDWRVTTTRLKEAIDYHVRNAALAGVERAPVPPTDELTTFDLHYVKGEPEVPVVVTCRPESHNATARLSYEGQGIADEREPKSEEWSLVLPAGDYRFCAEFSTGRRRQVEKKSWIRPVYRRVPLEVS